MVAGGVRDLEDLGRLEVHEVDARDARRVVAVDEEPATVVLAVGLRERGVVQVVPRDETVRRLEHRLGLLGVAPAVLRVLREDRDRAEQAAAREAVDAHLAAEAAGEERIELVVVAGGDVDALRHVGRAGERGVARAAAGVAEAERRRRRRAEQEAGSCEETDIRTSGVLRVGRTATAPVPRLASGRGKGESCLHLCKVGPSPEPVRGFPDTAGCDPCDSPDFTDNALRALTYRRHPRRGAVADHRHRPADGHVGGPCGEGGRAARGARVRHHASADAPAGCGSRGRPAEIVVGDVVRATEDNMVLVECFDPADQPVPDRAVLRARARAGRGAGGLPRRARPLHGRRPRRQAARAHPHCCYT